MTTPLKISNKSPEESSCLQSTLAGCDQGIDGAQWIGGPGNVFCRTEIFLKERPRKAILSVLADPHTYAIEHWQILPTPYPYDNWLVGGSFLKFRFFINSEQVGAGPFRPLIDGVPVLHEVDVTEYMTEGANALAVLSRGELKGFAAALTLENEDGFLTRIRTGEGWKQADANSVYRTVCWEQPAIEQFAKGGPSPGEYPEHLDGSLYPQGWREVGFDDSGWASAVSYGTVTGTHDRAASPYSVARCLPAKVRKLGEGNYLLDFGRAVFGSIELSAPAGGGFIELRLAEELQPNGHARFQLRTENCFQEIWRFAPDSEPLQHMGARMFRYAEVVGWRGIFDETCISALALTTPFRSEASSFSCSDEHLVQVWQLCKNTIAHTTADIFTDCLTRERLSYEADSYVTMLTHFATEGSLATSKRTLAYLVNHPSWPCEWQQFFVPLFHEYLLQSGDYDFVDEHYRFLRDEASYHPRMREGLIEDFPRECIVDWPESERDSYDFGPGNAVANALAYWNLEGLSKLAGYLGRERDAHLFAEKAADLATAFNLRLYDEASSLYVDSEGSSHSSLHANLYALRFGLVPEPRRLRCLKYIKQRGMACSVFTAQFLLETLFMNGEDRSAVALMVTDQPRSWREMIQKGAVTTTESWLTNPKKNMSWAHPWATAPANVIVRHLFGLRPTAPGWADYCFDPRPGGLLHGHLTVMTPRGPITASFSQEGGNYKSLLEPAFLRGAVSEKAAPLIAVTA